MEKLFFEENEDAVINRIYENFKKEPKHCSVIAEEKTEIIEEGVKLFKVSKKLYKLSDKLIKKAQKKQVPEVITTAKKVEKLAQKFEDAEDLYEIGRKAEAKVKYRKLIKDYSELLKLLKKSETITALKLAGGLAMTVASMTIPYMLLNKFFPALSFGAVNTAAAKEVSMLNQAKLYLKRAGAFMLCGIPTRTANSIVNNGISSYDDKITDKVDNLLT